MVHLHICNTLPLDYSKTYSHSQHCCTHHGGSSGISKLRKERDPNWKNSTGLSVSYNCKKEESSNHQEKGKKFRKRFFIWDDTWRSEVASSFQESSNSSIWDGLKFESIKFIMSGMDKRNRKRMQQIRVGYKKIVD